MATTVGPSAAKNSFPAFKLLFGNLELKIEKPAGFGAFAKIVNPPPVMAPLTRAHFDESVNAGTCEPK